MATMESPLLTQLNPAQVRAVTAFEGPHLVLAGAGSGKTTTLTRRIAYLMHHHNVPARDIVAVTFTNKAAEEMRDRVAELLRPGDAQPWVGTFHSTCVRILRATAAHTGYEKNFTIVDAADQLAVVKRVTKELDIPSSRLSPRAALEHISRAKNNLIGPEDFAAGVDSYRDEDVARVYERYQHVLRTNQSMDFDDLIFTTVQLFARHPDVLAQYEQQWRFLLVDEYQDTNYGQYMLVRHLARCNRNIFVVGDDWQSIYKWRGADVNNILQFEKDFVGTTVIALEQNYRSPQNVLDAAYGIIEHNTHRTDKRIWSDNGAGAALAVYEAEDEMDEAAFVSQTIRRMIAREGYHEKDFVVLYRTNAQARAVEETFMRDALQYRVVGGMKFYDRKEVKDILAYVRLVANPFDTAALERALGAPKKSIGPKTLRAWLAAAEAAGTDPIAFGADATHAAQLPAAKRRAIREFCVMITTARDFVKTHTVAELIAHLYTKSGYKTFLADGTEEGAVRDEYVRELYSGVAAQESGMEKLLAFIEHVSLASDTDAIDRDSGAVHVMTVHSVKGLEFPIVFMIGMEEGLMPHSRALADEDEMEEERRLAYVGVTRAKQRVFFVHARQRMLYGSLHVNAPSRFFDDMPRHLLKSVTPHSVTARKTVAMDFPDGAAVTHPTFGEGIVVAQTDTVIHVVFRSVGLKKLARGIAPLDRRA